MAWKTVDTFDDNGTTVALQQELYMEGDHIVPVQNHRVIAISKLL